MTKKVSPPDITIFLPTYFGEQYLEEMLEAIFKQKIDRTFEVLTYDTSSSDRTPEIIAKFAKKHKNMRTKTITKEEYGHGKTRIAAAHDSEAEFVVFISQDATPAHDRWLHELIKPFDISPKIIGVMGKQDPRPKAFPMLKREITSVFNSFGPNEGTTVFYKDDFVKTQEIYDKISFYSDVNSAARRKFLVGEIPYKDVAYAEDQLFGRDVIDAGYMKAYASRANVIHSNEFKMSEYKYRMFDETMGLRNVGIDVQQPSWKFIIKVTAINFLKDIKWSLTDKQYGWKRKIWGILTSPVYSINKWVGVRSAALADLADKEFVGKYSLEERKREENKS